GGIGLGTDPEELDAVLPALPLPFTPSRNRGVQLDAVRLRLDRLEVLHLDLDVLARIFKPDDGALPESVGIFEFVAVLDDNAAQAWQTEVVVDGDRLAPF